MAIESRRVYFTPIFAFYIFLVIVLATFGSNFEERTYHVVLIGTVITGIVAAGVIAKAQPYRAPFFYFCCIYCVFHFGLAPVFLAPESWWVARTRFGLDWYLDSDRVRYAYMICLLFFAGMLAANFIPHDFITTKRKYSDIARQYVYQLSLVVLIITIGLWYMMILGGGIGDYIDFNQVNEAGGLGSTFGFVHAAIDAAFLLAVLSGTAVWPFAVFLIWGFSAFVLGLRGNVAFPAVLAIAFLVSQNRIRLPVWVLVLASFGFLTVSSIVSVTRTSGTADSVSYDQRVLTGLGELGGSLRPVYEVTKWEETDGLQFGNTYYAPFERTFLAVIPIANRIPGELDQRLMNVLIMDRIGPYGFSIAAEAHYNFGIAGDLLIGALVGLVLLACSRVIAIGELNSSAIALLMGLVVHIRQSFVSAYGTTIITALLCLILLLAARFVAAANKRTSQT